MKTPRLFVGNLSFSVTEEQLTKLFGEHGEVSEVAIPKDREAGTPRGFAFVTMANAQQAEAAASKINGIDLDGRTIRVSEAESKPRERNGYARTGGRGR
jgi:cold-inducible RNA-binding protein